VLAVAGGWRIGDDAHSSFWFYSTPKDILDRFWKEELRDLRDAGDKFLYIPLSFPVIHNHSPIGSIEQS
jgi:hypothetical protein